MKKTDIYADFHVHTHLSPCGTRAATAQALLDRATAKGFTAIGFADHVTPQAVPGCAFYDTQRIDTVANLRRELAALNKAPTMPVMVGIEADYTLAGAACLDDVVLRECDHIIGAASHFTVDWTRKFGMEQGILAIVLDQTAHLLTILLLVLAG